MRTSQLAAACVMSITCAVAHPNFVYTNNGDSVNTVSAFLVGANGALTPIPGSPFPTRGSGGGGITTTFAKDFLYVENGGDRTISAFSIDIRTGRLSPVPGSPFPVGVGPMAMTPDDKFLIVDFESGIIAVNHIELNGALVPVAGSPFTTILNPTFAFSFKPKVTPDGRFFSHGVYRQSRSRRYSDVQHQLLRCANVCARGRVRAQYGRGPRDRLQLRREPPLREQ